MTDTRTYKGGNVGSDHDFVSNLSCAEWLNQLAQGRSMILIVEMSETKRTSSSVGMKVWQLIY